MHLALSILSAGVIVSSLAPNKSGFGQKVDSITGETFNESKGAQLISNENPVGLNKQEKISGRVLIDEDADDIDDVDFDGDEFDDDDFKGLLGAASATSLMHIHQEEGEILVPCFGMWWPVGGYNPGGGGYDYIDYYGDYRKKRRRSRKQKKAAKMKKKRS